MDDGEKAVTGRFYLFDRGKVSDSGLAPVAITNGPALSPDGRLLYFTDTLGQVIHVSDVHEDGTLGPPRAVRPLRRRARAIPTARRRRGGLPLDRPLTRAGRRGATRPTAICWSESASRSPTSPSSPSEDADLRTVYATTAAKGLDAEALAQQPEAGNLFSFRADVAGQPVTPVALVMRWLVASLLFVASAAQAAPVLNPLFSDHGVLQRGRPIAIWGTASPGEQVNVSLGSASGARDRRSRRRLARHPSGDGGGRPATPCRRAALRAGPWPTTYWSATSGSARASPTWSCRSPRALNSYNDTQSANDPQLRILTVPHRTATRPQSTVTGSPGRP